MSNNRPIEELSHDELLAYARHLETQLKSLQSRLTKRGENNLQLNKENIMLKRKVKRLENELVFLREKEKEV